MDTTLGVLGMRQDTQIARPERQSTSATETISTAVNQSPVVRVLADGRVGLELLVIGLTTSVH